MKGQDELSPPFSMSRNSVSLQILPLRSLSRKKIHVTTVQKKIEKNHQQSKATQLSQVFKDIRFHEETLCIKPFFFTTSKYRRPLNTIGKFYSFVLYFATHLLN